MINIILFGPPGSGKGTQSDKLIEKYGLIHLSTGNLLRAEISNKTPLGIEAKNFMDKGQLVPDEVVIGMIDNQLENHPMASGFLFDGFPRTKKQAEALDNLLELKNSQIDALIALEVSEEELVSRLLERGKTSGRSDDVDENIIRNRYKVYLNETSSVAEHYKENEKFASVKGEGSIDEIFNTLTVEIDKL